MIQTKIKVALVEDHTLVREGLAAILKSFDEFDITILAGNGKEFIEKFIINKGELDE